jgi:hypothetical protein
VRIEKFDESDLELVYQEKTADGEVSNFNKLVHPDSEEHSGRGKKKKTKSAESGREKKTEKKTDKKHRAA